jgi:membrane-associated phospholipid phosphatase
LQHDEAATTQIALDPPLDITQPAYPRWAAFFGLVAVALLVVMAVPALRDAVMPIDAWFWELAVNNEYPFLVTGAEAMALIGGTIAMAILSITGAVVLARQHRWPAFVMWVLVIMLTTGVNAAIKAIYDRPRPPMGLDEHFTGSFTSGHVLTAAVMVPLLVLTWVPAGPRRRSVLVVGAVYVLLMAASRMYLRVHWFTDVTAGLAIGAATCLALLLLARWWLARSAD